MTAVPSKPSNSATSTPRCAAMIADSGRRSRRWAGVVPSTGAPYSSPATGCGCARWSAAGLSP